MHIFPGALGGPLDPTPMRKALGPISRENLLYQRENLHLTNTNECSSIIIILKHSVVTDWVTNNPLQIFRDIYRIFGLASFFSLKHALKLGSV